jgi:hypothetical protein
MIVMQISLRFYALPHIGGAYDQDFALHSKSGRLFVKVIESESRTIDFICSAYDDAEDKLEASCLVGCPLVKLLRDHFLADGLTF